jgi:hypothetical protein
MPVIATDTRPADSIAPFRKQYAVTPSDTDELPVVSRQLYIAVGGTISCVAVDDTDAVTLTVPDNFTLVGRIRKVNVTGTTASGIVAQY